ncbi:TonB-dependent outer membrane protein, SusC/RagA (plasmid) [Gemmatirosa kalamazoonensis]|uniref:TonB-dependent outer membrane protein, SusC/RagA n=1 Tax=Gemmatirosa kalamazoonensis TaxID=861299 RepID=W0RS31_9BACT|nr:SusC/RagA family TonB-linked outer membrane protein [Gemmatirosa kalamazoonensis]AHG93779.1 TonB-dependent outer membrane protein, SusC/RagA [Gemmatirosa kalamazoonensis]
MVRPRCKISLLVGGLLVAVRLGAQAPTGTVSGRVIDSTSRLPVTNANVVIEGSQRGTVTRADGAYVIAGVPAGPQRVRVSRIGYAAQTRDVTVTAGGTVEAQFAIASAATALTEVVVVGYGTQRREAITGSVATVNADDAKVGRITAPTELLQGRVAGVTMIQNNGSPGAGVQVRIRGGTSISASNEPLYVIDGVPLNNTAIEPTSLGSGDNRNTSLPRNPLSSIDPSDIETITVLKDASATAIYGSRGANGVVQITTKHGREGRTELTYEGYFSSSSPSKTLDVLNGDEYRAFVQQQVTAGNLAASRLTGLGTSNTDWEKEVVRTAHTQNHNLGFSGGAASTQYRGSLNYMQQEGIVLSSGLERISGRINAGQQAFANRLRMGLNLNASQVKNDYVPSENTAGFTGTTFTNMLIMNPTQPVRVTDPSTGVSRYYEIGTGAVTIRNPVAITDQVKDDGVSRRILGNFTADYDLFSSLTAQLNVGTDRSNGTRSAYYPRISPLGASTNGDALYGELANTTNTLQTYLTYRASPGPHSLELLGGYEFNNYSTVSENSEAQGFITDAFAYYNLGAGATLQQGFVTSGRTDSRLVSFFGRANYSLKDRYFLTGVVRRDGSSRFGAGNKWAVFPAVSGSWLMSAEPFMKGLLGSVVSELRLKAGYGLNGSQEISPYSSLLTLATGPKASFGETTVLGVSPNRNPNPDLKWEQTAQTNVGLDFAILDGRFSGTVEYYLKNTRDLLLTINVPQPAVTDTVLANVGAVRNKGLEFTLDARTISRPRLDLTLGVLGSVERNRVVSLGKTAFITSGNVSGQGQTGQVSQRIMPGFPLGTFYGPEYVGVDANGRQLFNKYKVTKNAAGVITSRELTAQTTTPTADDYNVLGNANPKFSLGGHGQLRAGQLDASFLVRGVFGQKVLNNTALVYSTKGNALQDKNFLKSALNDPIGIKEPAIFSSRWIEDGSFVRLQNVTVGYTVRLPSGTHARQARVYVTGDNLIMSTNYTGYDPEAFTSAGRASRGVDYLNYPNPRTVSLGVRVGF